MAKQPAARKTSRASPHERMRELISAYWCSQLVFVMAKLGVADALARGPRTPETIAAQVGARAPQLRRALRALAGLGVVREVAGGRFRLTPLGETLRSDRPGSLRDFTLMMVDDYNWQAWGALLHGITSDERPFDHVHGVPFFEYLARHSEQEATFAASMASISGTENDAVARAYPFGNLARLVDVGGAHGHLLATILRRHKKLHGILYDQPQVVAGAASAGFLATPDLSGRHEIVGGSFFDSVPPGADAYLMKYILHDWDDGVCRQILGHCRDAMAEGGRVLVVDHVIPPGNAPYWGKQMDINMLVLLSGQERTREEFRDLFARAGMRLVRVHPTACPLSILEAVRA